MKTNSPAPLWATALLALILAGCSSTAKPTSDPASIPVRVATVVQATSSLPVRAVGTLEPAETATLAFKTGGPVASIFVDEGDRIRAGQLLARLALDEIDASVSQAQAALDKAQRDADRYARLFADSVITLSQLQDSETALEVARAQSRATTFNRTYAEIKAPASGRVLRRFAEPHEQVAPGAPILELGFDSNWVIRAGLPDVDVVRLKIGDEATVLFDALATQPLKGVVSEIAAQGDPRSGTFAVEITITEGDSRLRSGFIGTVLIEPSGEAPHRLAPVESLVRATGLSGTVFLVDPATNTVRERSISLHGLVASSLAIRDGLEPGDLVVTDGAPYLTDGATVTIVD